MNPTISTFPTNDGAFAEYVRSRATGVISAAALEEACRDWYPSIRVAERTALASFSDEKTWYAYRDGRAFARDAGDWWRGDGIAKVEFGREATFLGANSAAVALVGGALVGRPLAAVRPDGQADDPEWLWRAIDRTGAVASIARLRRLDGVEIDIEFRAERGAEPGKYVSYWRPVNVGPADSDPNPAAEGLEGLAVIARTS